jgi:hypothetical protein
MSVLSRERALRPDGAGFLQALQGSYGEPYAGVNAFQAAVARGPLASRRVTTNGPAT